MTPSRRPSFFRRRYLINRPFQFRFIANMQVLAIVILGIVYVSNVVFFRNLTKVFIDRNLSPDHFIFRYIEQQEAMMGQVFAVGAVVILAVLTVFGLFYSHRIAGPLYRFTRHLEEIAKGKPPSPVRFRNGDFFQEVAHAYNAQLTPPQRVDRSK